MKHKVVLVAEVHYSHRVVEVEDDASDEDIKRAAENGEEIFLEYSHTLPTDQHKIVRDATGIDLSDAHDVTLTHVGTVSGILGENHGPQST